MEISVLILSCVILGLNPVLPVLLYFIFLISRFVTLYGFYQIKYIHTYKVKRRRHKYAFNRCERTTNASLLTSIEAVITWPKQSSYKTAHFRKSDKQQIGYRQLLEQPQTVPRSLPGCRERGKKHTRNFHTVFVENRLYETS